MDRRRSLFCGALLAGTCLTSPALAQVEGAPPTRYQVDANGVDRVSGGIHTARKVLQIGPAGSSGLAIYDYVTQGGALTGSSVNWNLILYANGSTYSAGLDETSDSFTRSGNTFTPLQADGSSLTIVGSTYTYTNAAGVKVVYDYTQQASTDFNIVARGTKVIYPTGEADTLTWNSVTYCSNNLDNCQGGQYLTRVRLQAVTSSTGYQLHYQYQYDTVPIYQHAVGWSTLQNISAINLALDYCDPAAGSCTVSNQTPPEVAYSESYDPNTGVTTTVVTDPMGRATTYASSATSFKVKRPATASGTWDDVYTFVFDGSTYQISQLVHDGMNYTYSSTLSGNVRTITETDPLGHSNTTTADTSIDRLLSYQDSPETGIRRTTHYTYNSGGSLTKTVLPEGGEIDYVPDGRGNVTQATSISKTPGTPANIVTYAAYPTTCTNLVTCNKPTSTTDARGNVTSYAWDPTHGGITSVTDPATGGTHPQTRYGYTALYAYYKNSAGQIVSSGVPTYRLTSVSACSIHASCSGAAEEVKSTITYGSPGVANNLLPTSISKGAGDGSLTATTSATYDVVGNAITTTDPLGYVSRALYDADREVTETIGPDPDGTGPLKNRAQRFTYNDDGLVTFSEQGTANADGSGFVSLQQVATAYDAADRKTKQTAHATGTTYAAIQWSYDAAGRLDCTAQRMNPAVFSSLPAACSLGTTGSYGPDRISRNTYDNANQLLTTTSGYGSDPITDATYTYTPDGKVGTVADGKGNLTTYVYDGFDRLSKTEYPSPTTAGQSNPADYEQLGYDPNGNVTSRRLRDGNTINFTYDALNRRTLLDLPSTSNPTDRDVTYSYDLLGHLLYADQGDGHNVQYTWDALGRQLTQSGNAGTKTSTYDLAGRRTRLTWQDGFYVTYDYDNVGEMTAIRENGATTGIGVLATFTYDDLGERTKRTLGNGTSTTYGYDPISRLTSLALAGGTNTDTITLSNYSPAGEIGSRTESNTAFAWTQGVNANANYTTNGLNQYPSIAGVSQGYDARGNLTSSGGDSFTYNTKNQMSAGGSDGFLYYDALGRLDIAEGTRFDYDGDNLITELSSTFTVLRRYVFGPGPDEPIVWYEGSGTTNRHWMDQDERGSITRITSDTGATIALDSYDEYGIPASTNMGRFQYTGQAWLPLSGLYYYKARMYSPGLGRFMQTDPIGYANGLNWYNYVGSDPVNGSDPSGLATYDPNNKHMNCIDDCGASAAPLTGTRLPGVAPAGLFNFIGWNNGSGGFASSGAGGGAPIFQGSTTITTWRMSLNGVTLASWNSYSYGGGAFGSGGLQAGSQGTSEGDMASDGDIVATAPVNCVLHPTNARCGGVTLIKDQTPIPGSGGRPYNSTCYAARKICAANTPSPPYSPIDRLKRINQCSRAGMLCQKQVDTGDTGLIWFPDGTIVTVINGVPYLMMVGPKPR